MSCPEQFTSSYDGNASGAISFYGIRVSDAFDTRKGRFCYKYSANGIDVDVHPTCPQKPTDPTKTDGSQVPGASNVPGATNGPVPTTGAVLNTEWLQGSLFALIPESKIDANGNSQLKVKRSDLIFNNSTLNAASVVPTPTSDVSSTFADIVTATIEFATQVTVTPTWVQPDDITIDFAQVYVSSPNLTVIAPPGTDNSDLYDLRHPSTVEEDFIAGMGLDPRYVKYWQSKEAKMVDEINNDSNVIPEDALLFAEQNHLKI